jgi:predicted metal-binding protein
MEWIINMTTNHMMTPDSHALAIAFDRDKKPVCLLLSVDAIGEGGDLAIAATKVTVRGTNLVFSGPKGDLVLSNIPQMCQDAALAKLPVVVIDPENQRENKIEFTLMPSAAHDEEPTP